MTATIIPIGPRLHTPIGHVIRTGHLSYRQYEHLHAEGSLPAKHVIVDASRRSGRKTLSEPFGPVGPTSYSTRRLLS